MAEIQARNYRSPAFEQLRDMIKGSIEKGIEGSNQYNTQTLKGTQAAQEQDKEAKLKQLLQGSEYDLKGKLAQKESDIKGQSSSDTLQRNMGAAQQSNAPDGSSQHFGANGEYSVGTDPTLGMMQKNRQGEQSSINQMNSTYKQGLPKIQQTIQAANEGLQSVNDPKNIGSLGQARTLALRMYGMGRYNENEAKAVVPGSLQGTVSSLFNSAGDDASPLNESQKRSVNAMFMQGLKGAKDQHEILKQNSLGVYGNSMYADPQRAKSFQQTLGAPIDQAINKSLGQYSGLPTTSTADADKPAPTGMVDKAKDKLSSFFAPKASQGQPQQAPNPQAAPQQPVDPLDAEIQRRGLGGGQ